MSHLFNTVKHAVYVYAVALVGALGVAQVSGTNNDALVSLGGAAVAAAVKAFPKLPALLTWVSTEATVPSAPATGLAPEAE